MEQVVDRNAWFVGFAGNLVVGVWVGNDDNSPMGRVTGGSLPALIWRQFMDEARRMDSKFRSTPDIVKMFDRRKNPLRMAHLVSSPFEELEQLRSLKAQEIRRPSPKTNYNWGWGTGGQVNWEELIVTD